MPWRRPCPATSSIRCGENRTCASSSTEVKAVHGDDHLTAIDVLDGTTGEVIRRECGGLFVFIGADAETAWLPEQIVRDARGYVLTGADLTKQGHWSGDRDPYLLETS